MTELTNRSPHRREYWRDGKQALVDVDGDGIVRCSEELFDILLRVAGYYESTVIEGVELLDPEILGHAHG